jgi:AcrR family transcriptional regulator
MDAVETVMQNDGYAQLSARKIAQSAGLNYQLVFYYFGSVEELLVQTYRRRTERLFERYRQALQSARPFHALWKLSTVRTDGVLSIEYMAMSNHYASIRQESIRHVQRILTEMENSLPADIKIETLGDGFELSSVTLAFLISSVGNYTSFQQAQGISKESDKIEQLLTKMIELFDSSL